LAAEARYLYKEKRLDARVKKGGGRNKNVQKWG
jgi:hypothetical protein